MYNTIKKSFTDYHIIATIIMVVASLKWGDWKNWKVYYPTMLFFATGDFIYGLIAYNHPLWEFESPLLGTTFSDLLVALVFFSATAIIYLSNFPKRFAIQVIWVVFWVLIYTLKEILAYRLGYFSYHNGWSLGWSVLFNCCIFPLLWLHHRKPAWGLVAATVIAYLIIIYFKIPFSSMK